MTSRLSRIRDWESLAQYARYNVAALAECCRVSPRQLERFFQNSFGKAPHQWLHDVRMKRAVELLKDNTPVKEVAFLLRYADSTHFIHDFKKHFGASPGRFATAQPGLHKAVVMSHFDSRSRV